MNKKTFRVDLQKDYLVFSAAHFITFAGNICERIHGHNYKVKCTVEGPLDENRYVFDFIALRDGLKKIVDELDHRVVLPDSHPTIKVITEANEVTATFEEKRWVFPAEDCAILPVSNTTAELLADYILNRLVKQLNEQGDEQVAQLTAIEIGVDENEGQWGICFFKTGFFKTGFFKTGFFKTGFFNN